MIIVTGAAGFIGSCIVSRLNQKGREDIIIVDCLKGNGGENSVEGNGLKKENLKNKKYFKYYDKADFLNLVVNDGLNSEIDTIIHMGACSSTTLQDAAYFQKNNFEYTLKLAQWALGHKVRFIYASSAATYGDGSLGYKDDDDTILRCKPLNLYGQSKQNFDRWALDNSMLDKIAGLKFFNAFGPNEYHKGNMRSVVAKAYQGVVTEGKMSLFKSYNQDYGNGEQRRDFIYVKDAVDVVMFFLKNSSVNGIFNVGTGEACTWNGLAGALFAAVGKPVRIEYIEMPEGLKERYQYFTQADMAKLRAAGYTKPFTSLEGAVADYVGYLSGHRYL